MKILWITNIPFGSHYNILKYSINTSGSWLDSTYNAIKNIVDIEIIAITVSNVEGIIETKDGKHTFCIIPGGSPHKYKYKSKINRKHWKDILELYKPDLINIWGTEYTHGYLALQVNKSIPTVIYLQGIIGQIEKYYFAGMRINEILKTITIRDIIKKDSIFMQRKKYLMQSYIENRIINMSKNVIVENNWCSNICKHIYDKCNVYKSKLMIKEEFFQYDWNINNINKYHILCSGAGSQIKGMHIILRAINIVKEKYPETKLIIPGENIYYSNNMYNKLKITGYTKMIRNLIIKMDLKNQLIYCGKLNSGEMAKYMSISHMFIMPSSIENHSSTLLEALIVGMPCIASYVGGIPEYIIHEQNGLLYRFEDYEILAQYIMKMFSDDKYTANIANNGKDKIRKEREKNIIASELISIYKKILVSNVNNI